MESVFHEKQEGSLCAQHCLNALLQGAYFTPVDLATLGQQLDDEERARMAEGGAESEDYRAFLQQPSGNMDDSGYFSIQVLSAALKVWGVDLVPYSSRNPIALAAKANPVNQRAFICNFKDHWLTVRKLGNQWFNLNSLLTGPELISNTYLALFLTQLQHEGYSIFVVVGDLPPCEADPVLKVTPAEQTTKPRLMRPESSGSSSEDSKQKIDQSDLQRALELSRRAIEEDESEELKAAMMLSMQDSGVLREGSGGASPAVEPSPSDVRQRRQAFLDRLERQGSATNVTEAGQRSCAAATTAEQPGGATGSIRGPSASATEPWQPVSEMSEDEMLLAAIHLSMETK